MAEPDNAVYEFGPFSLDLVERELLREGAALILPAKVFDLLKLLVEQNGQTLEKDKLLTELWPDTFVEENSLTQLVFQLRKTLGESASKQQYIETVPRRGYRFVADVRRVQRSAGDLIVTSRSGTTIVIEEEEEESNGALAETQPAQVELPQTLPTPRKLSFKQLAAAVSLLLIPLIGLAAYRVLTKPVPPFQKKTLRKLATAGQALRPALSPDGQLVAYALDEAGQQSVWLGQTATTHRVQLVPPAETTVQGLCFSPDGQFVYFNALAKGQQFAAVYAVSILGGAARKAFDDVDSPVSFAPDGKQLAFIRNDPVKGESALFIANVDGTNERRLAVRQAPDNFSTGGPAWSPDGQVIACSISSGKPGESFMQVAAVNVADGKVQPLGTQTWYAAMQAAWLRDSSGIVVSAWDHTAPVFADQLWFIAYPDGAARQVTDELTNFEGVASAARADVLAAWRSERVSHLWVVPVANPAQASQLNTNIGDNYSQLFGLDWTVNGKLLYSSHHSGNADLWRLNADGTGQQQLTVGGPRELQPVATADGRYIVYLAFTGRTPHVWRMDADGSNAKQLTNGSGEQSPSVTADGRWVIFGTREPGKLIAKVSIEGGEVTGLVSHVASRPVVSPDSQWIACLYLDEETQRICPAIVPITGGKATRVFRTMPRPEWDSFKWTPDSRALTYIATRDGASNLWLQPIDGSAARQLTTFPSERIFRFAWSPDGKAVVCDRGEDLKEIVLLSDFRD